ncbi:MAG TPA: type IV pilus assembly protein PilM [Gaiellaceae bacterium]|nr:type IV pilus assembly protein PilM [Gaiellaceae bacterium]
MSESVWKKEITFRRKPREPKAPKEAKAKQPKSAEHKAREIVGLRIGSSQLAAARVSNNDTTELVQLARTDLERGVVVNGEVRDAEALTRALKAFFSSNKLPRTAVRLGIASNRIGVRSLDVPAIEDPAQFENAIRFRAQELLPIPVTEAILDHVVVGEKPGDDGETLRSVLLVFAHHELVDRYVEVCRSAGVRLSGIDLDAFALLRAVAVPRADIDEAKHALVAVAVGQERTIFAVSDGRIGDFVRVLEWGGQTLDVAIARTLDLTPSQAQPYKHQLSLLSDAAPAGISRVQFEAIKVAIRNEIAVLGRELISSLRFYQSRPESLAIGEVLLSGGAAQLEGFAEELRLVLGAPVRVADPLTRVTLGKKVQAPEDPARYAVAIGLGIEER